MYICIVDCTVELFYINLRFSTLYTCKYVCIISVNTCLYIHVLLCINNTHTQYEASRPTVNTHIHTVHIRTHTPHTLDIIYCKACARTHTHNRIELTTFHIHSTVFILK